MEPLFKSLFGEDTEFKRSTWRDHESLFNLASHEEKARFYSFGEEVNGSWQAFYDYIRPILSKRSTQRPKRKLHEILENDDDLSANRQSPPVPSPSDITAISTWRLLGYSKHSPSMPGAPPYPWQLSGPRWMQHFDASILAPQTVATYPPEFPRIPLLWFPGTFDLTVYRAIGNPFACHFVQHKVSKRICIQSHKFSLSHSILCPW
jgi:hypothetical protein